MKFKNNKGYVLFLNLILITLIGLFIPLLIQQQKINYKILRNRKIAAQNREAVESGLQYQLYFLKQNELLLDEELVFNEEIIIKIKGEEVGQFIYLTARLDDRSTYTAEMKLEKEELNIIEKINYRE